MKILWSGSEGRPEFRVRQKESVRLLIECHRTRTNFRRDILNHGILIATLAANDRYSCPWPK
jgi:hypothetical protein